MTIKNLSCYITTIIVFYCFLWLPFSVGAQNSTQFVIKNVNVIPMTSAGLIIKNANVVIDGNHIESINRNIPSKAKIIDGTGKYLIPGLTDAHVHLPTDSYLKQKAPIQLPDIAFNTQDVMTPIIANGVTTVFDLNSTMETFAQKKTIEKGYVIGPRIVLSCLINGGTGKGRIANTPEEGRAFVRSARIEGYDIIKVYSQLNIPTYDAIIDEAYKLGFKTVGHIPNAFQGKLDSAFVPHFGMVAHAEEFSKHSKNFSEQDALRFAALAKNNGTWVSPTLVAMVWIAKQTHSIDSIKNEPALKYVHPLLQSKWLTANNYAKDASPEHEAYLDSMVQFHFRLVKALKDAGVPIVAETDAGVSGDIWGFSLHEELELLVQSGLSSYEALNAATFLPAQWLGIEKQIGTVEAGKYADLVLLNDNPLTDIKNTRKIAGVFVNGKWLDKIKINSMLSDLAKRNTANKTKYDWKTVINNER